jgi:hypothetical protein
VGSDAGSKGLIHNSEVKIDQFPKPLVDQQKHALVRLNGRVWEAEDWRPQSGKVEIEGTGIKAFYIPQLVSSGLAGDQQNLKVSFYVVLTWDGPRAWDVQIVR